ncbi:PadR family transcriptional regulator [Branchiibius sp. NY16-3462-2]|uniref:PadR family transcriptional regulator n=1 Tax=Branchiibius sp. NY16-3462-2 TaxID=1807500 RepID=UPI00079B1B8B|nr:PadR family transcriptional regulator [Branchiibius sp. NY16-3462-2]KYH44459.1 hypothetical protein AZH51_08040 [Branchiibius sp. NY16-3462-2]
MGGKDLRVDREGAVALNATAASLLGFLHDGPCSGWDLTRLVETRLGDFWSITRSQVYRELADLSRRGLVEAGETGRRDARPYTLTDDGRKAFAAWAAQGPGAATIRLPLLLFVSLGRHIGTARLLEELRAQLGAQRALVAEYEAQRARLVDSGADALIIATVDYGIATSNVTIKWLEGLVARLRDEDSA